MQERAIEPKRQQQLGRHDAGFRKIPQMHYRPLEFRRLAEEVRLTLRAAGLRAPMATATLRADAATLFRACDEMPAIIAFLRSMTPQARSRSQI